MANGILQQFVQARGGLVGQRGQLAEQERFLEGSNLRSIGIGALEALGIQDEAGQNQFLVNRANEIAARGGDPTDTFQALDTPFAERQQVLQNAVQVAQQAGVLEGAPGATQRQALVRGTEGDFNFRDEKGNIFTQSTFTDPNTQTTKNVLTDATGRGLEPSGKLTAISRTGESIQEKRTAETEAEKVRKRQEAEVRASVKAGEDAAIAVRKVDKNIKNINRAISALDRGARTGAVQRFLPSIAAASVELDNIRNSLGLDIVSAATFGALSESELNFALDTAIPTGLNEDELKDFLVRKRDAQQKARRALANAAKEFASGKTRAQLLTEQEAARGPQLPPGVTEEDIVETMRSNNLTREQVLQRLGGQ